MLNILTKVLSSYGLDISDLDAILCDNIDIAVTEQTAKAIVKQLFSYCHITIAENTVKVYQIWLHDDIYGDFRLNLCTNSIFPIGTIKYSFD